MNNKSFRLGFFSLTCLMSVAASFGVIPNEKQASAEYDLSSVTRADSSNYVLVKSASELVVGRNVIIAAKNYNYAMSATQSTNNRGQVAITKSGDNATWTTNVGVFQLKEGSKSGTFAFYDSKNGGYLYAASSSANYLKTQSSLSANSSFAITFSSGIASVKAQGTYTRNNLKYNASSKLFSCYSSGQKDIAIYQEASGGSTTPVDDTVAVTGVSLSKTSASINVDESFTLTATVSPSNATNKTVTWSSSNSSVATVSNGVVKGVAAGSATITAKTADGGKVASCVVTVTKVTTPTETASYVIDSTLLGSSYGTKTISVGGASFTAYYCARYTTGIMQFKKSTGYLSNSSAISGLSSIKLETYSGKTFNGTLYSGTSAGSTTHSQSVSNGNTYSIPSGDTYFKLVCGSATGYLKSVSISADGGSVVTPEVINPTSISLSASTASLTVGETKTLSVSYSPSNVNSGKGVSWASSNSTVASVSSSGVVTAKSAGTATITATSTYSSSIKATCTVTVKAASSSTGKDAWTIMIYMCGNDLESTSSYRLATGDIQEILAVSGQPDDVNIIIETGGAKSWASTYGVKATELGRWHVEGKKLVKDASVTKANMGLASTFQSFLEWGLKEYPAEKTGVIMWNHGGAMQGVCYDENYSDDSLLNSEVKSAVSAAFSSTGRTEKLEFIGYDACLMAVQDIAEFNSNYFNYQISSEESEAGYGWDYDTWVDDLYAKKSTTTILKAIADGFIADNGGVSSSSNDQTMSYLNLSYMSSYKTAWENMASALSKKITSSNKSKWSTLVKSAKHYADSDYTYFGTFDAKDLVNKISSNSTFNPGTTYTNAVNTAFANLVEYSTCGKGAGNSNGLCCFWSISSSCYKSSVYTASQTNFTNWRSLNSSFGA